MDVLKLGCGDGNHLKLDGDVEYADMSMSINLTLTLDQVREAVAYMQAWLEKVEANGQG